MKYIRYLLFAIVFTVGFCVKTYAVNDAGRAALYALVTKAGKNSLLAQSAVLQSNMQGHLWNYEKVKLTNKFLNEYNRYLDSLQNVILVAANIYGIYYEGGQLYKNLNEMKNLSVNPKNVCAVALSPSKHGIYEEVVQGGIDVVSTLVNMLPIKHKNSDGTEVNSGKSTTEKRINNIIMVRQKMRKLNRSVMKMNRLMAYTSLMDTYYEYLGQTPSYRTKSIHEITERCKKRWRDQARDAVYR